MPEESDKLKDTSIEESLNIAPPKKEDFDSAKKEEGDEGIVTGYRTLHPKDLEKTPSILNTPQTNKLEGKVISPQELKKENPSHKSMSDKSDRTRVDEIRKEVQGAKLTSLEISPYPQMEVFFPRLFAHLLDILIVGLPVFALAVFLLSLFLPLESVVESFKNTNSPPKDFYFVFYFVLFLAFVIYLSYFIFLEYKYGQTLGKKLFRLKVVDIYRLESPILLHSLYRNLTKFFLSRQLYLGYFWYLLSDTRQTWHDVVAKTYVVRSNWRGEILPGGPSSYEKKPFLFILSFIFVMAAFVSLIFISVYLGFNLEEQNLRVSDFAKKEDALILRDAIESYYINNSNSYPWNPGFEEPSNIGLNLVDSKGKLVSWISPDNPLSLISAGEINEKFLIKESLKELIVFYDSLVDQVRVCFKPRSNSYSQEAFFSNQGKRLSSNFGVYLCVETLSKKVNVPPKLNTTPQNIFREINR